MYNFIDIPGEYDNNTEYTHSNPIPSTDCAELHAIGARVSGSKNFP